MPCSEEGRNEVFVIVAQLIFQPGNESKGPLMKSRTSSSVVFFLVDFVFALVWVFFSELS